jgi:TonB family protein
MNLPFHSSPPIVHPGCRWLGAQLHRAFNGAILIGLLQASLAQAQSNDTLSLRITPMEFVTDSTAQASPSSHRSAEKNVDRPVRVIYCPQPTYPRALADYGFEGRVVLRFVVDTTGAAELEDLVVREASHIGFVDAARRAVRKCRYQPAERAGLPVRFLVQQRVRFRQADPDSIP